MEKYNYKQAIINDIKQYIKDNHIDIDPSDDEAGTWLYDELWCEDSVTGNGAYYYDTEDNCAEYLCHNMDLVYEAAREFCVDDGHGLLIEQYENRTIARYFDCTVRCYLLGECIEQVLEELK